MINVFNGYSDTVVTLLRDAVDAVRGPDYLKHYSSYGLCNNILVHLGTVRGGYYYRYGVDRLFTVLYKQWPEYSGDKDFPVPCPNGGSAEAAYDEISSGCGSMYKGAYGASRLRLAGFALEQCAQELKRRSAQC